MNKFKIKKLNKIIYPISAVILFIAIWAFAAAAVGIDMILPSPSASVNELFSLIQTAVFWNALINTVLRSLISFAFSFLLAITLSAAGGIFNPLHRILSPIILILRATPTISVILLSLIWLTSGIAPMFIAFLIIFPAMYAAFYGGITSIDKDLLEMSKVYKVRNRDIVTKFYIPSIAPVVFNTVKSNISLNLKIIIASEVLAQTKSSMGLMMQLSKVYIDTVSLMAWTIAAIIISYLLELSVEMAKKHFIRWKI